MTTEEPKIQPVPTTAEQRRAGFDRLAQPQRVGCRVCGEPTDQHVAFLCRDCFVANDRVPPAAAGAVCGFCGRSAAKLDVVRESMIAGHGATVCSTCVCAAAGCMGAKDAAEARRMMAQSSLQAEAVSQCAAMMKRAGAAADESATANLDADRVSRADLALTLTQAAELMARIARGQS